MIDLEIVFILCSFSALFSVDPFVGLACLGGFCVPAY